MDKFPLIANPTAGELSVRPLRSLLNYYSKTYGDQRLYAVVKQANLGSDVDLAYLQNENNWVSFAVGQRLIDILDETSGDPEFIRKAGLVLASKETLGFAFTVFKAFGTPKSCYAHLFKTLHLYNRVGIFRILKLSRTSLRFSYQSFVDEPNLRFSEYRMNQFASIPTIWELAPAAVRKLQCQVTEGAPESIYELTWKAPHSNKRVVTGMLAGALMASISVIFLGWTGVILVLGGGGIGGLMGQILNLQHRLKKQDQVLQEQTDDLVRSMTEVQARYDEVQQLNVSLEHKVEERTAQLTSANERLQELDKLKDQFLANISHELRTPLVALSSMLQLILHQGLQDPQLQKRLLHNSTEALEDMLENVNDLLLKSRSEKGLIDVSWTEVEIGELVQRSLNVFDTVAHKHHNQLSFHNRLHGPLLIYVDRPKLRKILNNLVGNALKFTEHGAVTVSVEKTEDCCLLMVTDTGPGIPEEELDTIFEPFFQASNNPHRQVQGTGIGLSLVKDLVQLHHGQIRVESQLGQGSCFMVQLPLGNDHVDWTNLDNSQLVDETDQRINLGIQSFDDLDLTPFSEQRPYDPHVLLVEDNPQIIQVLAYVLKEYSNLHFAKDGQEGLDKTKTLRPDLIITDIMMPRKNGYELVQEIRQDPELKGIPIILLTSKADRTSRIQGFEHGADEYLTKPFNNQEVLVRVKGLIERKRLEIEFIHLEKMIALGQLAAGVTHEINNPIAYAKSAAETIEKVFESIQAGKLTLEEGMTMMKGAIGRVKDGIARAADITEALRGFIRQGAKGFQYCDIHPGIESALKIIHTNYKASIRFHKDYTLAEKVECNVNQLNQVVMNVLQNAVQALEGQQDGEISIHTSRRDDSAHILIQDNGPGIPKEQMSRIFDPFFTTKALGKGTGLGLHICQQIIDEHGGLLTVHSHEGEGVQCCIQLPLQRRNGVKHEHGQFTNPHIDRGVETIHYPHRG